MYSFLEIDYIFQNCRNWVELEKVCEAFCYLMNIGEMPKPQTSYIKEKASLRFREIENL